MIKQLVNGIISTYVDMLTKSLENRFRLKELNCVVYQVVTTSLPMPGLLVAIIYISIAFLLSYTCYTTH